MDEHDMNMEKIGKIMDDFIHDHEISLTVHKDAGTDEWTYEGAGMGPLMDLFVMLNTIQPMFVELVKQFPTVNYKNFVDDILDVIRDDIVDTLGKVQGGGK